MTRIRKIILLRPPSVSQIFKLDTDVSATGSPPLGLAYIAAVLDEAGYSVQVIDAVGEALNQHIPVPDMPLMVNGLTITEVVERIPRDTELIGVSCMFASEWFHCKLVLEALFKAFPAIPVVMGGEQATADADYILRSCPGVLACVRGEGEEIIVDLLDALNNGRDLATVAGIAYRIPSGEISFTVPAKRQRDLDSYPLPKWDLFPIEQYLERGGGFGSTRGRMMPMLASRGCPFRCTFCSNPGMWGKLWNVRSPVAVLEEMKLYTNKYGIDSVSFFDLTTIIRKDWIKEFCNLLIAENIGITWTMPSGTRSEAMDGEVIRLLKQSGCPRLSFAPESGSQLVLERIQKKVNLESMLKSMKACSREGIVSKAHIIMGFPFEARRDIFKSYWFMIRMAYAGVHDVPVYIFHPYPGSALNKELRASGALPPEGEAYDRFMALSLYNNYGNVNSWNKNISGTELRILALLGMAIFYSSQFLFRPWRVIESIARVARSNPTTLLERLPEVMLSRLRFSIFRTKRAKV
jgi:radical SAM superfamily enzyme YgiQ (UPF0313 family)